MDHIPPKERDFAIDLESGGTMSEGAGNPDHPVLGSNLAKTFFTKFCPGFVRVNGSVQCEHGMSFSGNESNSGEISPENLKLLIEKKVEKKEDADLSEKKMGNKKIKKGSAKKPPRPPKGLSLDAADQKLIKEIAELAMMKRARIERMQALKKMKASKASTWNGNIFALLFTILFCLAILFQGIYSKSSSISFRGSPESAGSTEGGFVLVHDLRNPSTSDTNLPGSGFPILVEQVSGSDPEGKVSRAAR